MLFPQISLQDWLDKYPSLKVKTKTCRRTKVKISSDIPFVSTRGIGLISPICKCGSCCRFSVEILKNCVFGTIINFMDFDIEKSAEIIDLDQWKNSQK